MLTDDVFKRLDTSFMPETSTQGWTLHQGDRASTWGVGELILETAVGSDREVGEDADLSNSNWPPLDWILHSAFLME